jgi:hypothetical protein
VFARRQPAYVEVPVTLEGKIYLESNSENERRQSARKKTGVQAELVVRGRTVPVRVPTSDLSLGGCYIENMFTLHIGDHLTVGLWIGTEKLKISGIVRTCDPVFGNGIEFLEIDPLDRLKLEAYLDRVSQG